MREYYLICPHPWEAHRPYYYGHGVLIIPHGQKLEIPLDNMGVNAKFLGKTFRKPQGSLKVEALDEVTHRDISSFCPIPQAP